jgi:hypothetical protein
MLIRVCKSRIHRATVTCANLDYVGSITIDQALIDAGDDSTPDLAERNRRFRLLMHSEVRNPG